LYLAVFRYSHWSKGDRSRETPVTKQTACSGQGFAGFRLKGSLEPGKLADITVRSRDIMTIPEDEIAAPDVVYTIVGGKVAYERR